MGIQESKPTSFGSTPNLSSGGSLRRSSLYKSTTLDEIQVKHELVRSLQSDIDIFAGNRTDERYKDLQQILAKTSVDLEQIKRKTNKDRTRERCDQVLREVKASIEKLEAKLGINDNPDKGLDLAAVESDSFINQSFHKPVQGYHAKPEVLRSLEDIDFKLQNLEKEVSLAIDLEDTKQFVILEKKITILYGDLVMIQIQDHTPLSDRRESFERRLISCNNQIKKCKRKLTKRLSEPAPNSTLKLENHDDIEKAIEQLSELEGEALTFEGDRTDKRYKELEQILERYWTKLYATDLFTDEERQKRDTAVEKTKDVLQALRKRAEENENQRKSLQSLVHVNEQIEALKKDVSKFSGSSTDSEYTRLDQDSRRLWANLNEIEDTSEHIRQNKIAAITNIKDLLKELSQNTIKRESQMSEDNQQKQLLKQVEEFQSLWNQLNRILNERPVLDSNITVSIIEMLESVLDGIKKKTRALTVLENRKSNASLVVTKVTDSSDLYVKYKSAPDLVPLQLGIPSEADVKAAPPNKTKVIAEMHRIGNEAKMLLQKIKEANSIKNEDKEAYENQLTQCKMHVNGLEYNKKSDTIESNRRRVNKIIDEGFKALGEKIASELTRSSNALEIMDIDAEIQFWRQQIRNFSGTLKDIQYEKIKNGLSEGLIKLQVLGGQQVSKQESIRQIQQYHQELETKLAENQAKEKCAELKRQTSQNLKATVEQVQKLKAQVDRFSGMYNGILYKQIEGNLKGCSEKLDTLDTKNDDRLDNAKLQTKQKIQKYLTILEEKSAKLVKPSVDSNLSKTQSLQKLQEGNLLKEASTYQRVYSQDVEKQNRQESQVTTSNTELPHHKINAIRENLVVIKEKVEGFSGQYKDAEYTALQRQMQETLEKLRSIDDGGHAFVVSSKAQYIDYIEKLLQYFEAKTAAAAAGDFREEDEV